VQTSVRPQGCGRCALVTNQLRLAAECLWIVKLSTLQYALSKPLAVVCLLPNPTPEL
jgi:hypothetical protein